MIEALDLVPDPECQRRHSLGTILALAKSAMLCGARSLYAIGNGGGTKGVLRRSFWGSARRRIVATLHRVFKGLDVAAFEGSWLANSGVEADVSLEGGVHGQE